MTDEDFKNLGVNKLGVVVKLRNIAQSIKETTEFQFVDTLITNHGSSSETPTVVISMGAKSDMTTDNLPLELPVASTSHMEQSQKILDDQPEPQAVLDNDENKRETPVSDGIDKENEDVNRKSYCRCSAITRDKVQNMEIPIRQYLQELDDCLDPKNKLLPLLVARLILPHDKQLIISKFLCKKMVSLWGNNYPPHCLKVKVARLLIQECPSLKSSLKNAEGHEHFSYGMFVNHLKYKIRDVDPSDRKNRSRKTVLLPINTQPDISEEDLCEMQVENLKLMKPDEGNKKLIQELTTKTRPKRLQALDSMTLNTILNRFPRFLDYKGLLTILKR